MVRTYTHLAAVDLLDHGSANLSTVAHTYKLTLPGHIITPRRDLLITNQ